MGKGSPEPDLDEFLEEVRRPGGRCTIAKVLDHLDDKLAAKLTAALANHDITGTAIEIVTTKWGHRVSASTVGRHRRGICSCD